MRHGREKRRERLTLNQHVMSGEAKCLCGEWDLAQLAFCHDASGMHRIHELVPSAEPSVAYDLQQEDALLP